MTNSGDTIQVMSVDIIHVAVEYGRIFVTSLV